MWESIQARGDRVIPGPREQGLDKVALTRDEKNEQALRLYHKLGCTQSGEGCRQVGMTYAGSGGYRGQSHYSRPGGVVACEPGSDSLRDERSSAERSLRKAVCRVVRAVCGRRYRLMPVRLSFTPQAPEAPDDLDKICDFDSSIHSE